MPPAEPPAALDSGDRGCLRPLLKLRLLIRTVRAGTVIRLLTTDPAAPLNLLRLVSPDRSPLPRAGA
jgi:tRNA 2-thiouridine synthesizing protein A